MKRMFLKMYLISNGCLPRLLRKLFYRNRKLLSKLANCVKVTINEMIDAIYPYD